MTLDNLQNQIAGRNNSQSIRNPTKQTTAVDINASSPRMSTINNRTKIVYSSQTDKLFDVSPISN